MDDIGFLANGLVLALFAFGMLVVVLLFVLLFLHSKEVKNLREANTRLREKLKSASQNAEQVQNQVKNLREDYSLLQSEPQNVYQNAEQSQMEVLVLGKGDILPNGKLQTLSPVKEQAPIERFKQQLQPTPTLTSIVSPEDASYQIEITPQFQQALFLMEKPAPCLFITGKAGTGKSTLLRHFVENTNKKVALLAPTGIAALNIRGQTIHSFFHFPPHPIQPQDIKQYPNSELYRKIDILIIDEISMVRADLMDGIDLFLRLNGRDYQKPFGGIPVVFFGDLYQLPPVVTEQEESQYFAAQYESPYFFSAHVFNEAKIPILELTKVYRQNDPDFIAILDAVRHDRVDQFALDLINRRVQPGFEPGEGWITLSPTNQLVSQINQIKLDCLPGREICFEGVLDGEFQEKNLPTSIKLRLKEGAQVMFVKNDINRRWVNGTLGKIVNLRPNCIQVAVQENDFTYNYNIQQETWESLRYRYDPLKGQLETEVIGAFKQYPLKLAWAVTIHKSQGLTFNQVYINLGNGTFAHGQAYVALSRCRTFGGIVLKNPFRLTDIRLDDRIDAFHDQCRMNIQ